MFIISLAEQKKGVVGHIDLSTAGKEVFIEIDPKAMAFPDSVGATLCHEICHKWLQDKGISSPIEIDNEILTDITTIFLGFGKIMLNGCEVKNVTRTRVAVGTQTTTKTLTSGYLDRDQLAFVYRLVCAMRRIPDSEYMSGLNREATDSILSCDRSFGQYYSQRFHELEATGAILKYLQSETIATQQQMAELNKYCEYVKQSFCDTVDEFLKTTHEYLEDLHQKAGMITQTNDHDPALRFLRSIRKHHKLEQITETVVATGNKFQKLLAASKLIARQVWKNNAQFPPPSAAMFNIVKCPKDGKKFRLPQDSPNLIVSCPTCRYRFAYNTTCVSFNSQQKPQTFGWARRIWNVLRGAR
jgi:hypothetical protein